MKSHLLQNLRRAAGWIILAAVLCPLVAPAQSAPPAAGAATSGLPADIRHLQPGDAAPDFSLRGIDDRTYTLADFKEFPVLMVIFLSNHCPFCHAIEPRMLAMIAEMKARGLGVVAINPNHPDAVSITELGYSRYNDSFEEMKLYAKATGFTFPYLYDGDTQAASKAYGALATPHVFIFDAARRLRYSGRYDDSRYADAASVTSPDARLAIEALLDGRPVPVETTKPMGCSTKWLEKKALVATIDARWKKTPIALAPIDAAGIAQLAANRTDKLRLINAWATWCAPCVEEFPDLVQLTRRLASRNFEIITLSIDNPKQTPRVEKFLQEQHAGLPPQLRTSLEREGRTTNHYIYSEDSQDRLTAALDPAWPGPVPHSLLIAPGGKVLWRHSGPIDFEALLDVIYSTLGTSYEPAPPKPAK